MPPYIKLQKPCLYLGVSSREPVIDSHTPMLVAQVDTMIGFLFAGLLSFQRARHCSLGYGTTVPESCTAYYPQSALVAEHVPIERKSTQTGTQQM